MKRQDVRVHGHTPDLMEHGNESKGPPVVCFVLLSSVLCHDIVTGHINRSACSVSRVADRRHRGVPVTRDHDSIDVFTVRA